MSRFKVARIFFCLYMSIIAKSDYVAGI